MTISNDNLIRLYKRMADITQPKCATKCKLPQTCCSAEYCEMTIEIAREVWDTKLERTNHPRLPLMGPTGCTAAPHFRPSCTLHLCSINAYGFDLDAEFTEEYFNLREEIDKLEYKKENDTNVK